MRNKIFKIFFTVCFWIGEVDKLCWIEADNRFRSFVFFKRKKNIANIARFNLMSTPAVGVCHLSMSLRLMGNKMSIGPRQAPVLQYYHCCCRLRCLVTNAQQLMLSAVSTILTLSVHFNWQHLRFIGYCVLCCMCALFKITFVNKCVIRIRYMTLLTLTGPKLPNTAILSLATVATNPVCYMWQWWCWWWVWSILVHSLHCWWACTTIASTALLIIMKLIR